ncbi:S-layer homology domain-containing protein [Patescibacteria group bacterium]|nr:S-layer homology domain-containing protein [Patescibacteria group bacterium]
MKRHTLALLSMATLLIQTSPMHAATGDIVEDPDSGTGTAIEEESGLGTILIEQISPIDSLYAEWTLIKPNNISVIGRHQSQAINITPIGNYSVLVDPLEGATASVEIYLGNELIESFGHPQANFELGSDETIKIVITSVFTQVGKVSITSDPAGLEFTLKGPNDYSIEDVTPAEYPDMPEGLYTATFHKIEGCIDSIPRSDRLKKDSRITLSLKVACEGIENLVQMIEQSKSLVYVTATVDGKTVVFTDVPLGMWFAPYVNQSVRASIMSGFKDEQGEPSGIYGPDRNVTIAELSKIAHEIAGIDETKTNLNPINIRARDTWFDQYFASAENLGWQLFTNTRLDPGRNATRAEVVTTLLQALDVPRNWAKGKMFTDVNLDTEYSSSIETAAADGLVAGYGDGEFKPDNPINRAEISKIISLAIDLYGEDTSEFRQYDQ